MRSFLFTCLFSSLVLQGQAQKAPKHQLKSATPPATVPATPSATISAAQPLQSATLMARTNMVQGKYVFCFTQPLSAYDVVFTFTSSFAATEQTTLNTLVSACMGGALMEAGAQLKAFDAIIIQPGARDVAIKFRSNVLPADYALATVPRHGGFPVFTFCEPVSDYTVVKNEKISWYNHLFGGTYYTISHVQDNLVKTASKNKDTEAILFGESASYIIFKK